jgi:hypothetical protein
VDPVALVVSQPVVELFEVKLEQELAFLWDVGGVRFKKSVDFPQ